MVYKIVIPDIGRHSYFKYHPIVEDSLLHGTLGHICRKM